MLGGYYIIHDHFNGIHYNPATYCSKSHVDRVPTEKDLVETCEHWMISYQLRYTRINLFTYIFHFLLTTLHLGGV